MEHMQSIFKKNLIALLITANQVVFTGILLFNDLKHGEIKSLIGKQSMITVEMIRLPHNLIAKQEHLSDGLQLFNKITD